MRWCRDEAIDGIVNWSLSGLSRCFFELAPFLSENDTLLTDRGRRRTGVFQLGSSQCKPFQNSFPLSGGSVGDYLGYYFVRVRYFKGTRSGSYFLPDPRVTVGDRTSIRLGVMFWYGRYGSLGWMYGSS